MVFDPAFMEEDRHSILYRNVINIFEGTIRTQFWRSKSCDS